MYEILSPFYKTFSDYVETFFIEYVEELDQDYIISGDIIKIRGSESMVPGLLQKTIDSLLILKFFDKGYDYLVRSNVSTVLNFDVIKTLLIGNRNVEYFGGQVFILNWLDIPFGIIDKKYFGTKFAQGTLIGISKKLTNKIIENRQELHYNIIDDVAIGLFVLEHTPGIECQSFADNMLIAASNKIYDIDVITSYNAKNLPVAWRNKSEDRNIDLMNMRTITHALVNSKNII